MKFLLFFCRLLPARMPLPSGRPSSLAIAWCLVFGHRLVSGVLFPPILLLFRSVFCRADLSVLSVSAFPVASTPFRAPSFFLRFRNPVPVRPNGGGRLSGRDSGTGFVLVSGVVLNATRFLHLFKFGLVVLEKSNPSRSGGQS